jgi:hypothetical protein
MRTIADVLSELRASCGTRVSLLVAIINLDDLHDQNNVVLYYPQAGYALTAANMRLTAQAVEAMSQLVETKGTTCNSTN